MENKELVSTLRIYAMLKRLEELETERKQNEYYKRESLEVMKIKPLLSYNENPFVEYKTGRENRRERRKNQRNKK